MRGTKGEIAPLVYVGEMTGTRFIVQRVVTQRVAQNLVRRGATNILAPNRAIAKNIAGRNSIRDFNPGPGIGTPITILTQEMDHIFGAVVQGD